MNLDFSKYGPGMTSDKVTNRGKYRATDRANEKATYLAPSSLRRRREANRQNKRQSGFFSLDKATFDRQSIEQSDVIF
jgi:hypothetical protein